MRNKLSKHNRRRQWICTLSACLTTLLCAGDAIDDAAVAADPTPRLHVIHPTVRNTASPSGGRTVLVNPPPLLWPASTKSGVRYSIRLSQDAEFPPESSILGTDLPWAVFNPHKKLKPGIWHWQQGATLRPGDECKWSDLHSFKVDHTARDFLTPPAAEMIAGCPKGHPRLLIDPDKVAILRDRLEGTAEAARISGSAARLATRDLPKESAALPNQKGEDEFQSKNFAKWASKGFAGQIAEETSSLAVGYLAGGDRKIGRAAVGRAIFVAHLDPDGVTARSVSDFADGSCMRAMALAYDCCYDLLSEQEKKTLQEAMTVRAGRFYSRHVNQMETRVFSAHSWQHIMMDFADVAYALVGEVPEADTWAAYIYEIWIARVPLLGGDDGGWANGVSYFGSNMKTLLAAPTLFGRLTGADFFNHPWYRNVTYYHVYCWPPGSASDGFGDGAERDDKPSGSRGDFFEALGDRFQDPYAIWYARRILADRDADDVSLSKLLRQLNWKAAEPPEPKPPLDLPQARAFRDVGIVSMHTDLVDASNDLMVGFRSSPFGSYNHMHACQNALNLLYAGGRVFSGSGYYIAYGDAHFKDWYTATRGHNSVLIDDTGQERGCGGFGYVARFLHGRQVSYCLGDASSAYGGAGLTRFRRHLVMLRPSTVVVYDELEADHPARWSWLLHGKTKITADARRQRLATVAETARAQVDLFGSGPLDLAVTNRFDPPAVNWRNRTSGGTVLDYPDQWHVTAAPKQPVDKTRFLAIIQVAPNGESAPEEPVVTDGNIVRLGEWTIDAELNAARTASLEIKNSDGTIALAVDTTTLTAGSESYELDGATSILVEASDRIVIRAQDELPEAAR